MQNPVCRDDPPSGIFHQVVEAMLVCPPQLLLFCANNREPNVRLFQLCLIHFVFLQELKPEDHFLDSYSLRNLVWSQPDDYEVSTVHEP
jgi:hypothetical protein